MWAWAQWLLARHVSWFRVSFHHLINSVHEHVDVRLRMDFGHAIQRALSHPWELRAQIFAAEDSLFMQLLIDLLNSLSGLIEVHHELFKVRCEGESCLH